MIIIHYVFAAVAGGELREGEKRDGDGIELFALMSLKRKPRQKTLPLKRNEEARNTPNKGCRFSPLFKRGRKFISFRLF